MPILAKLGTLEHALDREQSPHLVKALGEIRIALLESKTKVKLSLEGLDSIPVYLQLLSDVEDLALFFAEKITSLIIVSSLKKLNRLDLDGFHNLLNLKTLTDLPSLKILEIRHTNYGTILEGVESFPSLEIVDISSTNINNTLPLEQLPNLANLVLEGGESIVNQVLNNHLSALQELSFSRLYDLRAISIGQSLPSLKSLSIVGASYLTSITGLNYLPHLEKLTIRHADNLKKLDGLEEAVALKDITLGEYKIDFLRKILRTQLASGRYQALQPIWTSEHRSITLQVDLLKDKFNQENPIDVRLLEHQSAALAQFLAHTALFDGPFEAAPNSPLPPERERFIAYKPWLPWVTDSYIALLRGQYAG